MQPAANKKPAEAIESERAGKKALNEPEGFESLKCSGHFYPMQAVVKLNRGSWLLCLLLILLAGCGSAWKSAGDGRRAASTPLPPAPAPVLFTYLGLSDDQAHLQYRITVNTSRPIEEVDIQVWEDEFPAERATYVWRNVVGAVQEPIRAGQTYAAADMIYPNARHTDAILQQVIFRDGGIWVPH